ncbi:MAG: hypothetical protein ABIZ72_01200 [Candidatus Limnocylindrales bacterium]
MIPSRSSLRVPLLGLVLLGLIAAVTIPALAAGPSAAPAAAASDHPGKGPKASKGPEVAVTLRGVVAVATDADGQATYTISANGKTIKLDAGPSWFFGANHPLKPFVGKTVTITGGQRADEVDVETVDGVRLRAEGKPPWAGGWKAVGSAHPGWSQEKADRWAAKHAGKVGAAGGGCWPPGQCKDHGPDESEAPGTN